jgi:hypothetical protein
MLPRVGTGPDEIGLAGLYFLALERDQGFCRRSVV